MIVCSQHISCKSVGPTIWTIWTDRLACQKNLLWQSCHNVVMWTQIVCSFNLFSCNCLFWDYCLSSFPEWPGYWFNIWTFTRVHLVVSKEYRGMAVRDAFPSRLMFLWSINVDLKYSAWFLICSQRLMSNLLLFPFPTSIHMLKLRTIHSAKLYFQHAILTRSVPHITRSASFMVGSWINLSHC